MNLNRNCVNYKAMSIFIIRRYLCSSCQLLLLTLKKGLSRAKLNGIAEARSKVNEQNRMRRRAAIFS